MLHSAPVTAPKSAALPALAPNAPSNAATAGGPSFAQLLSDQPAPQPPAPAPASAAPSTPSPARASETASKEAAAAPPPPNSTQARRKEANASTAKPATPAQPPAAAASSAKAADAASASDGSDDATEAATDAEAADPAGLNEFTQIIGLTPPTAQPLAANLSGAADEAEREGLPATRAVDIDTEAQSADVASAAGEHRPADASARAADATRAKGIELAADKAAASRTALHAAGDATQATGATPGEASPHAPGVPDPAAPNFAALMAQALPGATTSADAAPASASGRVHAALHSNAFAPELAANVSLLAVDGTQQAELQLNPADMGPVTVQIVVDGTQAEVSFHAVQAETRQALEQSLPDLAAALQGQGLTLSGGGVFQQFSREPKSGDAEPGSTDGRGSRTGGSSARVGDAGGPAPAATRRAVGLLDTFA